MTSGAVSYTGALVLNVVLARSLGVLGFGVWAIAFSTALALSSVSLLGADWIVIRNGSYFEGVKDYLRLRRLLHIALAVGGTSLAIVGGGLFLLAPIIARNVFHDDSATSLLRLAGVTIPVMGIQQIMLSGTRVFKTVRELVYINNVAQPVVRLVVVGIALWLSPTAAAAFAGLLAAEVCLAGAASVALNRRLPLVGPTEAVSLGETMNFGLPAWGTRLVENLRKEIFPILLGSLAGFGAGGVYVVSRRVAGAPSSVVNSLLKVYTPIASDLYLQKRRDELVILFQNLGKWSFALAFPLFCFLVAFPREILSLFGQAFADYSTVLILLAVAMLLTFATGPVSITLIISGRPRLALVDYLMVVAMEIGLAIWLIPEIGVLGAAIAKVVGNAVNNILPLAQVWRLERIHPYRLDYWKPLAAGTIAIMVAKAVVAFVPLDRGVVSAALAAVVLGGSYVVLLRLLGLSEEDRVAISTLTRRSGPKESRTSTVDMSFSE